MRLPKVEVTFLASSSLKLRVLCAVCVQVKSLNLQLTASPLHVAQGHDQSATLSQHTAELTLPKHSPLHRDLLRYAKLMEWLKNTHREKYEGLSRVGGATRNTFRVT